MLGHRLAVCLLAVSLLASPAAAQRAGSVEVGVLLRGTLFDPSLKVQTALGAGGRAGVYLAPRFLIEADISTTTVNGLASFPKASYRPFHARVNFLTPYADRGKLVVGLGVVATHYGGDFGKNDNGLASLFGLRLDLHRSLVARVDLTFDFVPSPANGANNNLIGGMQIGVGYQFGQ
jgi:hypothetical protein